MSESLPIFDRLVAEFRSRRFEDEQGRHEWRDRPTPYPRPALDDPTIEVPREES
jgi:hypothetical protein